MDGLKGGRKLLELAVVESNARLSGRKEMWHQSPGPAGNRCAPGRGSPRRESLLTDMGRGQQQLQTAGKSDAAAGNSGNQAKTVPYGRLQPAVIVQVVFEYTGALVCTGAVHKHAQPLAACGNYNRKNSLWRASLQLHCSSHEPCTPSRLGVPGTVPGAPQPALPVHVAHGRAVLMWGPQRRATQAHQKPFMTHAAAAR